MFSKNGGERGRYSIPLALKKFSQLVRSASLNFISMCNLCSVHTKLEGADTQIKQKSSQGMMKFPSEI